MLPIRGPFNSRRRNNVDGTGSYDIHKESYRQMRPYNLPLTYGTFRLHTVGASQFGPWNPPPNRPYIGRADASVAWTIGGLPGYFPEVYFPTHPEVAAIISVARERLRSKISSGAEALVTLAERKQAMSMMSDRLVQLYRFSRALRRGRFGEANDLLRVPKGFRAKSKSFSGAWLEYHFGWSPLAQDIFNASTLLSSPIPFDRFVGRSSHIFNRRLTSEYGHASHGRKGVVTSVKMYKVGASCFADVEVENPNLYLASSLGMTNPATVLWELVPFSFVVDWFVNVSDFLGQWSEFHGIRLKNAYYSYKVSETTNFSDNYYDIPLPGDPDETRQMEIQYYGVSHQRNLGIPSVTLGVRKPWLLSSQRGLTAASLLIQKGLK